MVETRSQFITQLTIPESENTHLRCKGKYHCTANHLIDGFEKQVCNSVVNNCKSTESKPVKQEVRCTVINNILTEKTLGFSGYGELHLN